MICPSCGASNASGRFCPQCGEPLPRTTEHALVQASAPLTPRRRRWPLIVFGGIFLLMTACVIFLVVASIQDPVALALSVIAAIVPAAVYSYLVLRLDRYEQEPRRVLLAAFGWGAVGAIIFSVIAELFAEGILISAVGEDAGTLVNVGIGAPIIEETFKGLALVALLVFFRHEFDNVLDGLVYGALVGLGFAMTENILYFGAAYLEDGAGGLGELFVARAVIGGFGHALYTGTLGAAVGWARARYRQGSGRFIVPVLGWCLAVFQHFLWNTGTVVVAGLQGQDATVISVVLVETPLFILPALIILFLIAVTAGRRELAIIQQHLAPEVARGVLTPGEYDVLGSGARRRQALATAERLGGKPRRALLQRFFQAAAELAFRKYHLSRGETPKPGQLGPEDAYRKELASLREQLA